MAVAVITRALPAAEAIPAIRPAVLVAPLVVAEAAAEDIRGDGSFQLIVDSCSVDS